MRPQSESNWRLMPADYAVIMCDVNINIYLRLFNAKAFSTQRRKD